MDDLLRVPGHGGPRNIHGIARSSFVAAAVHAMVGLEVTDNGLDLDTLLQRFFKPGFFTLRMRRLSFLGNGYSLYTPSPSAVLLFYPCLIKSSVSGDFPRCVSHVCFDLGYDRSHGFYIGDVALVFFVSKNQPIVIHRKSDK